MMKYIHITSRLFKMLGVRVREGALLISLLLLYAVFEGFGIGLLLPVLQYIESGGSAVPRGGVWSTLAVISAAFGMRLNLGTLLAAAFVPILLRQGVYYVSNWYSAVVQNRAIEKLTVRMFSAIADASVSYVDSQDQGSLIGLVAGQTARCGLALVQFIKLLSAAAIIVVYVALLMALSWQLAMITVVATVLVSWGIRRILVASRQYGAEVTNASVNLTSALRERFGALRLVKMRAREHEEVREVGGLARSLRVANTRIAVASARVEVIVDPALMLAVFIVVFVGVTNYGLTLASLGLFMFILLRLTTKAKELNVGRQALASLLPAFDCVEQALGEAERNATPRGGERPYEGLRDAIRFEDVSFSYGEGRGTALQGVTIVIPKGSMTAIVGRSGAGKSTLVDMIPLLRAPDSGRVMFDGVPAQEFDLASLRRRIGFLTQEPILFNDTIRYNLVYGLDPIPDDARIEQALRASYCFEFVSELPEGLETNLGDRGVRFSGGQRQRLALARVLLQDPDILILDEPTSALDSQSEHYIQQALEGLRGTITLVIIAHRLATVESADQTIVLSDGMVVETGTHASLKADSDGWYSRLFDMQLRA